MREDLPARVKDHVISIKGPIPFTPVSSTMMEKAQIVLGFQIPELLRSIYLNVGNGGFGPGYGIIGLEGGGRSNLGTLVETYRQVQDGAKYLGLEWKAGLLPFCDWGCNIFSCVDCYNSQAPVYQSEECVVSEQDYSLEDFFTMWLDGADILGRDKSPKADVEIINPFTRQKTRVVGQPVQREKPSS